MGLDSFCTITDTYNTDNKSINLTHLMTFNNGILGGFYNNNGKEFCESKLYKNILKVSSQLGLPLISINSNMTDFMSKYYSKRVDYFLTNILVGVIMSLGHLFEKYYISSVGLDFSYFSIKEAAFRDVETFDLFTLYCCSISGGVRFIVGSGEKNRYEKMKTIRTFDVARQNLQSCLTEHYNCMNCQKCKRNLVTLDALECLDEFSEVYDIGYYRKNRNRYIEWMCQQVQMNNHASDYIIPAYNIIKKREPELINSLTVSNDMLISQKNEMKRQRNVYRSYGLLLRKSLTSPDWKEKTLEWFKRNNIKNVVIYGYNLLTLSLLELRESLKINIVSIIYNKKPNDKIPVPVLPENTTDYPDCDAVIVSNVDIPELLKKKISYLTDAPIYLISEIFALK